MNFVEGTLTPTGSAHKDHDIRLAVFDFEGTLVFNPRTTNPWEIIKRSTWELISESIGAGAERRKMFEAYYRGEFDYLTWARMSVDNFKKYGLTRQKLEKIITDRMEIMPGTQKLFHELELKGIKRAVISGGIKNVYDLFAKRYNIKADYVRMASELNFDSEGRLVGSSYSNLDSEGKVTELFGICKEMGIGIRHCSYVGDAKNDILIMKKVGLPVAINTDNEELKRVAHVVIEDRDISQLLRHIRGR